MMQKVVLQVNNEGDFMNTLRKLKKTWISSAHQGYVHGKMASNTLAAYRLAAQKGVDMIETDARMTKDGILIANHDPEVRGYDEQGMPVCYTISETAYSAIRSVHLTKEKERKRDAGLCSYAGRSASFSLFHRDVHQH